MFIVSITYIKPIKEVEKHFADHVTWLNKYYALGKFIASGRKIPRTGGIILVKAASKSTVEAILEEDPFNIANVATYEITEFQVTKTNNKGIDLE